MMFDCPYNPLSNKFSIKRCSLCRSTNPSGYSCRGRIFRLCQRLGIPLEENHSINFPCRFFDWNFDKIRGNISLKGVRPLESNDCENSVGGICLKLGIPTETKLSVEAGRINFSGDIPICEVCLSSPRYSKLLEEKFKEQKKS